MAYDNNSHLSNYGMFSSNKNMDGSPINPALIAEICRLAEKETVALKGPLEKIIAMRSNNSNNDALQRVNQVITAFTTAADRLENKIPEKQSDNHEEPDNSRTLGR